MLAVRIAGVVTAVALGLLVLLWFATGERRWLSYAWLVFKISLFAILIFLLLLFAEAAFSA